MQRILFNSHGRLGVVNTEGSGVRFLEIKVPGQQGWGWGPVFTDRKRIVLSSYEDKRTWIGTVQSHLWIYDIDEDRLLEEIGVRERPAPFMLCAGLMPGERRMIAGPVIDGEQRVWTMNMDGSEPCEVTQAGEGFTYCVQLSPN
ncbi:MAG: hypothetical protein FJY97_16330 [candidate division Zixibacteria bacterium]|nr:hypothetical protein [candidate division Zixibacteria bacterium]